MSFLEGAMTAMRYQSRQQRSRSGQLTLGDVIMRLEDLDPDESVCFDFGYMIPTTLGSWRGSYDELALGFVDSGRTSIERMKVRELLQHCRSAVGRTFEGWKGGDFVMSLDTPVWVANPGEGNCTAIVGVEFVDYQVIIQTAYREF